MAMNDYYERFYIQERIRVPTGYPPPSDYTLKWADGASIAGVFIQDKSLEARIAQAQGNNTTGRFSCALTADATPKAGDILRRERDNLNIRLTGSPLDAPKIAVSQIRVFGAEVTEPPDIQEWTP